MKNIIITGPGGSGKDYAINMFRGVGLNIATMHTTRPKRKDDTDISYHYISEKDIIAGIISNKWFKLCQFGPEWYGISLDEWNNSNVSILPPVIINKLDDSDRKSSIVIYLNISEEIRRRRLSTRSDADVNLENRLEMDHKNFDNFNNYDIEVTDENFTSNDILNYIRNLSDK